MPSDKRKTAKVDDGVPETRDALVRKVFDLHRRSHHYNIRKMKPEIFEKISSAINDIPLIILKESFIIYRDARNKTDDQIPHPNYFLAVARRLFKELPDEEKYSKTIWGKTI